MIRFIRSLFAWEHVKMSGGWFYEENGITGKRRAWRSGGHSPLDMRWLFAGHGMPNINGIPAWRSAYRDSLPDGWYWA